MIAVEKLRELVSCDFETGRLTWLTRPNATYGWNTRYAGKPALDFVKTAGYRGGVIGTQNVSAHRAIFALAHGRWPVGEIDHINGDKLDNRLSNLREVDPSGNRMNQCRRSDNSSGVTGVYYRSARKCWIANICSRGKRVCLGSFRTREAAVAARFQHQRQLGFGPNHGAEPKGLRL